MAAPAVLTQGTTFQIDDVGGSTNTAILGIKSASGIGSGQATEIDVTTLASTAKEFRMGLQDFGSFTLELIWNLDDAGQTEMYAAMDTQLAKKFIITLPATEPTLALNVWTATVYVLKMEANIGSDGVVMGSATLRVTGEPVWS